MIRTLGLSVVGICAVLAISVVFRASATPGPSQAQISFELLTLPFRVENSETPARNAPETMPGGVAVFDYDGDGRTDIFFTNGANIATLRKDDPKYGNRLFRNDGNGKFTDVTARAGLAGTGFDIGAAVADYDNDGHPDLFVVGVHQNTLYHNNGNGTFTDVTSAAGLARSNDPQFGPLWSEAAAWVDVNNDGLLDLFVVNYLSWKYSPDPLCAVNNVADYCHPRFYKGTPNQLFLNRGNGRFEDVSEAWGIRAQVGKGMGVGVADYDNDGKPDLFVTNDAQYNFLFHNTGSRYEEMAFTAGVALSEDGKFISGMGLDFRDFNNDGLPDIFFVALQQQSFPLLQNAGDGTFRDVTTSTGLRNLVINMAGFGAGMYDFDNDGWKDIFVTRGHVASNPQAGQDVNQLNTVFRNAGRSGHWEALTEQAGLGAANPARHRGCSFADFNGDGKVDVVATALGANAEIWVNRSPDSGHWIDVALEGTKSNRDGIGARLKLTTATGVQYNHQTSSVGYASSSDGPVHFGIGNATQVDELEVRWPSGIVQTLRAVVADRVIHLRENTAPAITP